LEQKLAKSEQKASELNDKLLRSLAEIENVRRRSREEVEKASNYAISNFVTDLVVVAENFFMACDNTPKEHMDSSQEVKNFVLGIEMTKNELMKILQKNKVKRIFPLDEQFDHNFHEAISRVESEKAENTIVQVIQAGYSIGDRLIRPALVVVSGA
jgi:molecular chaperone GrpE